MIDRHYTPAELAELLADTLALDAATAPVVADFASGDGGLLRAVVKRNLSAELIACDLDGAAVAAGRKRHPDWRWAACNFLRDRSTAASPVLRAAVGLDAVVLNPPYSCRGQKTVVSHVFGHALKTSPAVAFIARSLPRLRPDGEVAVLVPAGSLTSEKDAAGWAFLRKLATVTVGARFGRTSFCAASASTAVVHLRLGASDASRAVPCQPNFEPLGELLTLYRGRVPANATRASPDGLPLLHTTDLVGAPRDGTKYGPATHALSMPLLIVPRVGRPDVRKIRLLAEPAQVVPSDCLFALSGSLDALAEAQERIQARWIDFAHCYTGSCAPYTTLSRLQVALDALGILARLEPRLEARRAGASHGVSSAVVRSAHELLEPA